MKARIAVLNLVASCNLDAKAAAALWHLAGFDQVPQWLLSRGRSSLLLTGMSLTGFGLMLGVAANWPLLSRLQQFILLQTLVLAPCAVMTVWPRVKVPFGLLALISIGALFAYFSQTYPAGADNWQMFAVWSALGLPLAVCVRADSVWSLWAVITLIGIALWDSANAPYGWEVDAHGVHATAAISGVLVTIVMSRVGHRFTGAGRWACGISLVLFTLFLTATAILDLRHSFAIYYRYCVVLIALAAFAIAKIKPFNVFEASVVALSLIILVVGGVQQVLLPDIWNSWVNPLLSLLLIALLAIGLTVGVVRTILLLARREGDQRQDASSSHIDQIMRDAVAQGLLEKAMVPVLQEEHRWPTVVLTALAAWLSVLPLTALIMLWSLDSRALYNVIGIVEGVPILVASVFLLRRERISLFLEHLGLPGLLVGATLIFYQVDDHIDSVSIGLGVLVPIAAAVAVLVPQAWIRALMGAAIGLLIATSLSSLETGYFSFPTSWLPWLAVVTLWVLLYTVQRWIVLDGRTAQVVSGLEAVLSGMAVTALVGIALSSGHLYLLTKFFNGLDIGLAPSVPESALTRVISAVLGVGAGCWLAWCLPPLRNWWYIVLVGLASLTASFVPALGPLLLVLFICFASGRYVLTALAGVCAAWLLIGLYYAPEWTLATKAFLLTGVGVTVALIACLSIFDSQRAATPLVTRLARLIRMEQRPRIHFLLWGLLVLAVTNTAIWQKESPMKNGTLVYVEIAPSDPRSLIQGDYMRLDFALPWPKCDFLLGCQDFVTPSAVVARVDRRGVAQLPRFYYGEALAHDEFLIELVVKRHGLTIVTDAWYFKEGEAKRWSRARYGEFRVAPNGQALLVGLRGTNLEKL